MKKDKLLNNWNTLKPLLLAKWAKLNVSDLEGIQPTLSKLVEIIQRKYKDIPEQSIIEDLENLDDQILKNS
jgi:hypothetical protein